MSTSVTTRVAVQNTAQGVVQREGKRGCTLRETTPELQQGSRRGALVALLQCLAVRVAEADKLGSRRYVPAHCKYATVCLSAGNTHIESVSGSQQQSE